MARPRSWTDDDLRAALDGSRTMREVVSRLRLSAGGASHTTVRTRMEQLGLEPPRGRARGKGPRPPPWRRTFTEESLERAVAASSSLNGVFDELGIHVGGGQWVAIRQLIIERGWSTAHWTHPIGCGPRSSGEVTRFRLAVERADLAELVSRSRSRADVIRALGFEPRPSLYRVLRTVLRRRGTTTDHFEPAHARMRQAPPRRRRPLAELLTHGSSVSTHTLRLRLIEEGVLEARCSSCGLTEWLGHPIPLQLDHIDGDRLNDTLENLRLLCPTCHALTDTYCGRNIGRYDAALDDEHGAGE